MRSYLNSAFSEELLGLCADTWRKQDFMLDKNSLRFLPVPQCCRQSPGNVTEQFISHQFWRNIQFLYLMLQNNCFVLFFWLIPFYSEIFVVLFKLYCQCWLCLKDVNEESSTKKAQFDFWFIRFTISDGRNELKTTECWLKDVSNIFQCCLHTSLYNSCLKPFGKWQMVQELV